MTTSATANLPFVLIAAILTTGLLTSSSDGIAAGLVLPAGRPGFVYADGEHFALDGKRFPVAGVNNHYLTFGSEKEVTRVLDDAAAMGANVVRTFVQPIIGSPDGDGAITIWDWRKKDISSELGVHGAYMAFWDARKGAMAINEGANGLQKLDFLVAEAGKRNLKLIVALVDYWAFTGGSQQMRAWYGSADEKSFFFEDERTRRDYKTLARAVIERVNPLTGVAYKDDPTVFAWELMNEADAVPLRTLQRWLAEMSAYIKSLDSAHMVSSGLANITGVLLDAETPSLDFATWHGYPLYRGISPDKFTDLIGSYCNYAETFHKPVLLEEFGYARSNADFALYYKKWLAAIDGNPHCAGWLVWRLVSLQDIGRYPVDSYDQFDVHNDNGLLWRVLKEAAGTLRASGSSR